MITPKGFTPHTPRRTCPMLCLPLDILSWGHFSDFFLSFFCMFFWLRFLIDFWLILVPTWLQLGLQIHPKFHPRASKNRFQNQVKNNMTFWLIFWSILDRFLIQNWSKFNEKSTSKSIPKLITFSTKFNIVFEDCSWCFHRYFNIT